MIKDNYSKAFSEVRILLKNIDSELVNKIPQRFMDYIEENYDKNYVVPNIDTNINLDEQGLLDETITIISLIYRNYWCDEKQRKEYDEIIKENDIKYQGEIREKYNPDNIFKNKDNIDKIEKIEEIQSLTVYKESWFKKIWIKIKEIFRR